MRILRTTATASVFLLVGYAVFSTTFGDDLKPAAPEYHGTFSIRKFRISGEADGKTAQVKLNALDEVSTDRLFTEAEADAFFKATSLTKLQLHHGGITDRHLRDLKNQKGIRALDVSNTSVTGSFLEEFPENEEDAMYHFDSLDLRKTKIHDEALRSLVRFPKLRVLNLGETEITDTGLKHLEALDFLEELHPSQTKITLAGLKHLNRMLTLRRLHLPLSLDGDATLAALSDLTGLEWLTCKEAFSDAGLKSLGRFTNLKTLTLWSGTFTPQGLREMRKLPHLTRLSFRNSHVTAEHLKEVAELNSLQRLAFMDCKRFNDECMRHIGTMTGLTELDVSQHAVTDEGGRHLRGLTNLTKLNLGYTTIGDRTLAELRDKVRLTSLDLWDTKITAEGLRGLTGLRRIVRLQANLLDNEPEKYPDLIDAWKHRETWIAL